MPLYEFRCRQCDSIFEQRRPMAEANAPATCPDGHPGAARVLSVFASVGSTGPGAGPGPSGSACCGGGCCG